MEGTISRSAVASGARCPVCASEIAESQAIPCSNCEVPHHPECLNYNGRCAIYGCKDTEVVASDEKNTRYDDIERPPGVTVIRTWADHSKGVFGPMVYQTQRTEQAQRRRKTDIDPLAFTIFLIFSGFAIFSLGSVLIGFKNLFISMVSFFWLIPFALVLRQLR